MTEVRNSCEATATSSRRENDAVALIERAFNRNHELEREIASLRAELGDTNRMLREADQLTDRERQVLDMWPKFEDGECVWLGDAVVAHHEGAITVDAIEFSHGKVCVKDAEDGDWNTSMYAIRPLKRPAPKVLDADGVEIKVGDTVWSTLAGPSWSVRPYKVKGFDKDGCVLLEFHNEHSLGWSGKRLTHTRPDSWEQLEEDAEKIRRDIAHNLGDFSPSDFDDERDTVQFRVTDLVRRAKALAGVEEAKG